MPFDIQQLAPLIRREAEDAAGRTLDKLQSEYQFGVYPIPVHAHNGTDSNRVDPQDLVDFKTYAVLTRVTLTSAQIKALNTTPITLVPAQGVTTTAVINTAIIVDSITAKLSFNTTAYAGVSNLMFKYTNINGASVTGDISGSFLSSTSSAYRHITSGSIDEITPALNAPVVVCCGSNPTTGDSTITFVVKYRLVSL